MAYGVITGQKATQTAAQTSYNNSSTSSIISSDNVQGAIDNLTSNTNSRINSLNTRVGSLNSQVSGLNTEVDNLAAQVTSGLKVTKFIDTVISANSYTKTRDLSYSIPYYGNLIGVMFTINGNYSFIGRTDTLQVQTTTFSIGSTGVQKKKFVFASVAWINNSETYSGSILPTTCLFLAFKKYQRTIAPVITNNLLLVGWDFSLDPPQEIINNIINSANYSENNPFPLYFTIDNETSTDSTQWNTSYSYSINFSAYAITL